MAKKRAWFDSLAYDDEFKEEHGIPTFKEISEKYEKQQPMSKDEKEFSKKMNKLDKEYELSLKEERIKEDQENMRWLGDMHLNKKKRKEWVQNFLKKFKKSAKKTGLKISQVERMLK